MYEEIRPLTADGVERVLFALVHVRHHLEQAQASLEGARTELDGEVGRIAARMAKHLEYLQEVADLVCHEVNREKAPPGVLDRLAPVDKPL